MATEISSQELGMVLYRADTFRARISDFWKTRNRVRVGGEPLPALFASLGAQIVATDQSPETGMDAGWASSCLSGLNQQDICPEHTFSRLVTFREVNMNDIDADLSGQFDFCWSSCALEHLGSLQHGLDFIENSLAILKPGGIPIHTTEFNLSSNRDTIESQIISIYRRCDIETFMAKMADKEFIVSPIDWTLVGEGFAETVVDLPPFDRGEPTIRIKWGDYDMTSIGIIIENPSEANQRVQRAA